MRPQQHHRRPPSSPPQNRRRVPFLLLAGAALTQCSAFDARAPPLDQPPAAGGRAGTTTSTIFVGGLSPSGCDPSNLRDAFRPYGQVTDVALHGIGAGTGGDGNGMATATTTAGMNKKSPFAFVTFAHAESARWALDHHDAYKRTHTTMGRPALRSKTRLYRQVKTANPIKPRRAESTIKGGSKRRQRRQQEEEETLKHLTDNANVILQCPKSHLQRLEEYIVVSGGKVKVLGSLATGRRGVKLLFLQTEFEPTAFVAELLSRPFVKIAVSKSYVVDAGAVKVTNTDGQHEEHADIAAAALDMLISTLTPTVHGEECVVKVQAFPPSIQHSIIGAMEEQWDDDTLMGVDIRPTDYTHTLSVVKVGEGRRSRGTAKDGSGSSMGGGDVSYMMGLTRASFVDSMPTHARRTMEDDVGAPADDGDYANAASVIANDQAGGKNRAYDKLDEAFARYHDGEEDGFRTSLLKARFRGGIALDCGASPGGWTKWLIEQAEVKAVYSIDPGDLANDVLRLKGVRHMKMRVENALPILQRSGNGKIDLWTSDMCLHDMSEQIDWLLEAKERDMLSPRAMFVLTLKCTVGHSRAAYDNQVEEEVRRLDGVAMGVKTMHLFSNRSGERTVVGFVP